MKQSYLNHLNHLNHFELVIDTVFDDLTVIVIRDSLSGEILEVANCYSDLVNFFK